MHLNQKGKCKIILFADDMIQNPKDSTKLLRLINEFGNVVG